MYDYENFHGGGDGVKNVLYGDGRDELRARGTICIVLYALSEICHDCNAEQSKQ